MIGWKTWNTPYLQCPEKCLLWLHEHGQRYQTRSNQELAFCAMSGEFLGDVCLFLDQLCMPEKGVIKVWIGFQSKKESWGVWVSFGFVLCVVESCSVEAEGESKRLFGISFNLFSSQSLSHMDKREEKGIRTSYLACSLLYKEHRILANVAYASFLPCFWVANWRGYELWSSITGIRIPLLGCESLAHEGVRTG